MARRFLTGSDTTSNGAVPLVKAMQYAGVQLEAIPVVAGNVPVDQGTQNALNTVVPPSELAGIAGKEV